MHLIRHSVTCDGNDNVTCSLHGLVIVTFFFIVISDKVLSISDKSFKIEFRFLIYGRLPALQRPFPRIRKTIGIHSVRTIGKYIIRRKRMKSLNRYLIALIDQLNNCVETIVSQNIEFILQLFAIF